MLLSGTTTLNRAPVVSPPPAEQPASSSASRQAAAGPHRAKSSSSARPQLLGGRPAGPAAQHLPTLADEHDQAGLARGVVEPDPLARDGDRMAEVELVGVVASAFDIVLADDSEQADRAVVLVHGLRRRAMDLRTAIAVAGGEDEHERAVAPEVARGHLRPVDQLGGEVRRGERARRRLRERDRRRDRLREVAGAAGDLVVPAAARGRRAATPAGERALGASGCRVERSKGGTSRPRPMLPSASCRPASCRARAPRTSASPSSTSRPRTWR